MNFETFFVDYKNYNHFDWNLWIFFVFTLRLMTILNIREFGQKNNLKKPENLSLIFLNILSFQFWIELIFFYKICFMQSKKRDFERKINFNFFLNDMSIFWEFYLDIIIAGLDPTYFNDKFKFFWRKSKINWNICQNQSNRFVHKFFWKEITISIIYL